MEDLIALISARVSLSDEEITAISKAFKLEQIPKKTLLLKEGKYTRKLYFIRKGLVRTFYYFQGNDVSSWFYEEGYFFTSWFSFYSQKPSLENIQAIEDLEVYSITYESFQKLIKDYRSFERFSRLLAEEQLAFIDEYSKGYMFLSAKERYQLLIDYIPNIELRAKVTDIASFLGISRETLSRIRSKR